MGLTETWITFSSPISSDTFLLLVFASGLLIGGLSTWLLFRGYDWLVSLPSFRWTPWRRQKT
jgi:hypothetical protein